MAPESLGIEPDISTVPWRAERLEDGTVRLVFGGIDNVPLDAKAVEVASEVPDEGVSPRAAWACNVNGLVFETVIDGPDLRSAYEVSCNGVQSHRVDWQFIRTSYRGWLGYSEKVTGGFVADVTIAQTVRSACPRGTAGSYQYRIKGWSVVTVDNTTRTSPPFYSLTSGALGCGTGIS